MTDACHARADCSAIFPYSVKKCRIIEGVWKKKWHTSLSSIGVVGL